MEGIGFRSLFRRLISLAGLGVFGLLLACANPSSADAREPYAPPQFQVRHVETRLAASEPEEYAFFASSVSMSGTTLAVGAWGDADAGRNTGAVYVFEVGQGGWTQTGRLVASDATAGARFGHSVAVAEDTILVGALYDSESGPRSGSVYVFEREGHGWLQTAKILPVDGAEHAHFGTSVALHGSTAIIGAAGPSAGSAYFFQRTGNGWEQLARMGPVPEGPSYFGISVDIHGDVAVVGAPSALDAAEAEEHAHAMGAAHVYERRGSAWQEVAELRPPGPLTAPPFGVSVAVGDDVVVVGSPGTPERVYAYRRTNQGWMIDAEFASGGQDGERFGVSVAIDGDFIAVGAPGSSAQSGAAYVYGRSEDGWSSLFRLVASDAAAPLLLGGAVGFAGGVVVSGATADDGGGTASGAAYAYSLAQPQ